MSSPNTKFHQNTVSNVGQETSDSSKGLNITELSFYETLRGEYNQKAKRLTYHLKSMLMQVRRADCCSFALSFDEDSGCKGHASPSLL
jgi:hypothetical protein